MLAGAAATQQCFNVGTSFGGLLPSDVDGARLPPAGSPDYVVGLGASANQLAYWKFHVDWATPASTSLTGPATLATENRRLVNGLRRASVAECDAPTPTRIAHVAGPPIGRRASHGGASMIV
jgi:hypothetical protein